MPNENEKLPDETPDSGETPNVPEPPKLFRPLDEVVENAKPLHPLWGDLLYCKAITMLVGDPGVCKTTFGYGLGGTLVLDKPFLNIHAEEPTKVLYMDFESGDSLIKSRKRMIFGDMTIPGFYVFNIADYFLPQVADDALQFCNQMGINLLFIDNQSMAFATRDENDNAEAIKQMRYLRTFTNAFGGAVVLFHHSGKADHEGTRKGTGAYARARLADICIEVELPDKNNRDVVRLSTSKNRLYDSRVDWYLKKEEGSFVFSEAPSPAKGQHKDTGKQSTVVYRVQQSILGALRNGNELKRGQLVMMFSQQFPSRMIDEGLAKLMRSGRLYSPKYGFYARKEGARQGGNLSESLDNSASETGGEDKLGQDGAQEPDAGDSEQS